LVVCDFCRGQHACTAKGGQLPPLKPHQERGIKAIWQAIDAGERAICLTSPTGGGKTRLSGELVMEAKRRRWPVVLYTHRQILTGQTSGVFHRMGIDHGVLAAGYNPAFFRDVQIASLWTINARAYARDKWQLPPARLVLVDEAHDQKGTTAEKILNDHKAAGAVLVGITATPVDLGHIYDRLIVAGTTSELRKCGMLLPCETYAPTVPDLHHVRKNKVGEYEQDGVIKAIMVQSIFGHVYEHWKRLNPDALPTILFAPGVKESMWFVDQFRKQGVTAGHIDGEDIYLGEHDSQGNQVLYKSDRETREQLFEASRKGEITVISNRFVCREGLDLPHLAHGIFATAFGRLSSYLQSGGRLLRAHPGLSKVVLQDHGGNYFRHGSLNDDRVWRLGDTDVSLAKERSERQKKGDPSDPEPICCPQCQGMRKSGDTCPFCGYRHKRSVRWVLQVNGQLKRMTGSTVKKKAQRSPEETAWMACLFKALHAGLTFNQVRGMYYKQCGRYPPAGMPHMPEENHVNWSLPVREVCPYLLGNKRKAKV
jgi:superfamily II DNA or RNA helicase